MPFKLLNLCNPIMRALSDEGYKIPTPIQEQMIPLVFEGRDVFGCAQTGTGKTAAFSIPIIQMINKSQVDSKKKVIKSLIMTPTRELASQIGESLYAYGHYTNVLHTVIFGGESQKPQTNALRHGVDIVVATPGRLLDLMNQGFISLANVEYFVLDEADRMLDMGFIHDINKIIAKLPRKRQTLFLSATMPNEIEELSSRILSDPVLIAVTPKSSTVEIIDQSIYFVEKRKKKDLLLHLLQDDTINSALVFSRTKHGTNKIAQFLLKKGINVEAIHGNKSQAARKMALSNFKMKVTRVLVATDIAARGIDIDELSHVFNLDLPEVPETYVHRIGRTGRAGLGGTAIAFCDVEEKKFLSSIQTLINRNIPVIHDHPFIIGRLFNKGLQPHKKAVTTSYRKQADDNEKKRFKRRSRLKSPSTRTTQSVI